MLISKRIRGIQPAIQSLALLITLGTASVAIAAKIPSVKTPLYQDLTEPRAAPTPASVGKLDLITLASNSLAELDLFYADGLGLVREGPLELDPNTISAQRALWNMPQHLHWQEYRYHRANSAETPALRVLLFAETLPAQHRSWDALEPGPMAIGFPNTMPEALDARLRRLGFGAQSALNRYPIQVSADLSYEIKETIFNGPDFVKAVAVYRSNGIPLAPIDAASQLGGPGYVSMVVDDSAAMLKFLTEVLDFEVRADREATTTGALGAPAGTKYRFLIAYAKGSTFGHLLLLEYRNAKTLATAQPPVLPHRGLGLMSFKTAALDDVLKRAAAHKLTVRGPTVMNLPGLGQRRVAVIRAPNGMEFELIGGK